MEILSTHNLCCQKFAVVCWEIAIFTALRTFFTYDAASANHICQRGLAKAANINLICFSRIGGFVTCVGGCPWGGGCGTLPRPCARCTTCKVCGRQLFVTVYSYSH